MICPACTAEDTRVVDTRSADRGGAVRRRRECSGCGERFTTYERIERHEPMVVKRSGRRETFDVAKVARGLRLAVKNRPVADGDVAAIVAAVESEVLAAGGERTTDEIGRSVLGHLEELDPVAYLRFASVHRAYGDPDEFLREAERLRRPEPSG